MSKVSYMTAKAASRAYGELDDFLESIRMKLDRVDRNFDRLLVVGRGEKHRAERERVTQSIADDIERVSKDIKSAEKRDLEAMHEDKQEEYRQKLLKLKRQSGKAKKRLTGFQERGLEAIVKDGDELQRRLLSGEQPEEVELLDMRELDVEEVGRRAEVMQGRTKDAAGRILSKVE